MRRREFMTLLGGALAAAPVRAYAQSRWRLGVLTPALAPLEAIRSLALPELAKEGFVEDQNLTVEVRIGTAEALRRLAHDLVSTEPDVVIAVGDGAISAVLDVTRTTPIVGAFIDEDPVAAGFAKNLERPGGTVTGIVMLAPELDRRRLELLREAFPNASHMAALAASVERDAPTVSAMQEQARRIGVELRPFYAPTPDVFPETFRAIKADGIQALAVTSAPELATNAETIARLAIESKIPTMCEWPWMAQRGCLIGYGPVFAALYRRTADYVGRILRGARAGDLPIEHPTHFGLAVNTKTAKALDIEIPAPLLARATQVIE